MFALTNTPSIVPLLSLGLLLMLL